MSRRGDTVTLLTVDYGDVTLPEPAWCVGHEGHVPQYRADLSHYGPKVYLEHQGRTIGEAVISQAPCAERGTRAVEAFVVLSYEGEGGMGPAALHGLADEMVLHADRLRVLADELGGILAGGEGR
ncbi:DUF6907 domain-containing protein [Streptomyces sp. NBC_00035]|uniref:DUF6907 domain-containing protein n=1 Tax=Streptomyces sp. NBC_00035 TaxID=2903614 RepID=UPI0032556B6C